MTPLLFLLSLLPLLSLSSHPIQPCVLTTTTEGADIADDASKFPNPFAWYTNPSFPGVTLPGPSMKTKCNWKLGYNFQWDSSKNTCILNGQGYPLEGTPQCNNGLFAKNAADFNRVSTKFIRLSREKGKQVKNEDSSIAYVGHFNYQGNSLDAAMSIGHGVLSGLCGNCFLIRKDNKYVFQMQTDVRAWSLELSGGANVWLASDNYGGTCYVPEVVAVDCDEMMDSMT